MQLNAEPCAFARCCDRDAEPCAHYFLDLGCVLLSIRAGIEPGAALHSLLTVGAPGDDVE